MARRSGGEAAIRARLAASPGLSDSEAHTLAGLLDAESHLAIGPNNGGSSWRCVCRVTLRDDDQDILLGYRDKLGLGHLVSVAARGGSRPQVSWAIASKLECRLLTEVLDAHPLRGRKQREYEYEAARLDRNPEWPTRNTIAEAFGGWYEALRCAGLASRAAGRQRERRARIRLDRVHRDAAYRAAVVRRLRGRLQSA